MPSQVRIFLLSALLPAVAACGDDGLGDADPGGLPLLGVLPEDAWTAIEPGGETTCSDGSPFQFYVWPGRTDRLVVNFVGGGACWNPFTCAAGTFTPDLSSIDALIREGRVSGIFDMSSADNPIAGYTHVVVPYCTGDIHWGDNVQAYGESLTIRHKGAVNTRAVLDWVYANVEATDRVLTTGCSAGGYGASMWGGHVMNRYPEAHHVLVADSSAGVITDDFFSQSFPNWNATEAFPDFIPGFDANEVESLSAVFQAYAAFFPEATFAQYNTIADWNQTLFYDFMGGVGGSDDWSDGMLRNVGEIAATAPNFRFFTGGDDPTTTSIDESTVHCILNADLGNPQFEDRETAFAETSRLYLEYAEGGVTFRDWLAGLLDPDADPGNVACEGCDPIGPPD